MTSQEKEVQAWNDKYPVGQQVEVRKDLGEIEQTRTRSEAWVLSGHTAVIMLEGISGAYLLNRVRAIV